MEENPPRQRDPSATIWSPVFAACLLLAAAHVVQSTLSPKQGEAELIEEAFTRAR